jgi:hypothetical protein
VQQNAAYGQTDTHDSDVAEGVVWFVRCAKEILLLTDILTVTSVRLEQTQLSNALLNINYTEYSEYKS